MTYAFTVFNFSKVKTTMENMCLFAKFVKSLKTRSTLFEDSIFRIGCIPSSRRSKSQTYWVRNNPRVALDTPHCLNPMLSHGLPRIVRPLLSHCRRFNLLADVITVYFQYWSSLGANKRSRTHFQRDERPTYLAKPVSLVEFRWGEIMPMVGWRSYRDSLSWPRHFAWK